MKHKKPVALSLIPLVLLAATLSACATYVATPTNDPFTRRLDSLYRQRQIDQTWMIASASTTAAGITAGTTFTTLNSLNQMDPHTANIGTIISYIVTALAAGSAVWAFVRWQKAVSDYMETLKLQTQYYNLLQPQN